jgi:hypothetical protein
VRHTFRSTALAVALVSALIPPLAGVLPAAAAGGSSSRVAQAAVVPNLKQPRIEGQACQDSTGITVVVDFRDLPNKLGKRMNLVRIGCAEQPVGDGFDALLGAGFHVDPTVPFVCTIDDRPLDGDCASHAYWSYSHGLRGHRWKFSTVGAGDWNPPEGSLEGWSWSPFGHEPGSWSYPRVSPRDLFPR